LKGTWRDTWTPMFLSAWLPIGNSRQTASHNRVHPHTGILVSHEKEGNSGTCYSVGVSQGHSAQWSEQTQKDTLQESTHRRSLESSEPQRQEAGWWVPGPGEGRELVFNGDRASYGEMEGSRDGWWGQLQDPA
jgi:hypothetical protein